VRKCIGRVVRAGIIFVIRLVSFGKIGGVDTENTPDGFRNLFAVRLRIFCALHGPCPSHALGPLCVLCALCGKFLPLFLRVFCGRFFLRQSARAYAGRERRGEKLVHGCVFRGILAECTSRLAAQQRPRGLQFLFAEGIDQGAANGEQSGVRSPFAQTRQPARIHVQRPDHTTILHQCAQLQRLAPRARAIVEDALARTWSKRQADNLARYILHFEKPLLERAAAKQIRPMHHKNRIRDGRHRLDVILLFTQLAHGFVRGGFEGIHPQINRRGLFEGGGQRPHLVVVQSPPQTRAHPPRQRMLPDKRASRIALCFPGDCIGRRRGSRLAGKLKNGARKAGAPRPPRRSFCQGRQFVLGVERPHPRAQCTRQMIERSARSARRPSHCRLGKVKRRRTRFEPGRSEFHCFICVFGGDRAWVRR